jgi:hypothetical protein
MTQPGSAAAPEWSRLQSEISLLETRLAEIERHLNLTHAPSAAPNAHEEHRHAAEPAPVPAPDVDTASLVPLIGRAVLGIAGAYLLRALTEAGVLHPALGVGIGFGYAAAWLAWAARASQRLQTALLSITSVLVLCPLIWEATLRFGVVSTWTAGGVLALFTVFGLAISWRKNLLVVATIAMLAGLGTAAGLLIATHDVLPFTWVFLTVAAAVEISACLDHWLSERWIAAAACDLSVLLATWLVTNPRGLPEGYAPVSHGALLSAQTALVIVYLMSVIVRTLFRGFTFTAFETAQCAAVFLIGAGGAIRNSHNAAAIACLLLACSAACYGVSFTRLEGAQSRRNFFTYSTLGLLIALGGSLILFSGTGAILLWWALALASVWAGGFFGPLTLQLHGLAYLLTGLFLSGAFATAGSELLGAPATGPRAVLYVAAMVALAFVAIVLRYPASADGWLTQALRLVSACVLVFVTGAVFASALTAGYHALSGQGMAGEYCSTLRTSVLAFASLILAWAGTRWGKPYLSRLMYPFMALGAYRLITQDLGQGKTALFFSLLVYGAALMLLPRLSRQGAGSG